jgi:hypothetical protein
MINGRSVITTESVLSIDLPKVDRVIKTSNARIFIKARNNGFQHDAGYMGADHFFDSVLAKPGASIYGISGKRIQCVPAVDSDWQEVERESREAAIVMEEKKRPSGVCLQGSASNPH